MLPRHKALPQSSALHADLQLMKNGERSFAGAQLALLTAIDQCGSITAAARQLGISYKTAWERIETMNNLAEQTLVVRTVGGAQGGGTAITEYGRQILKGFELLQQAQNNFLESLGKQIHCLQDVANFMHATPLQTNARNQFRGQIKSLRRAGNSVELSLTINSKQSIVAVINEQNSREFKLNTGDWANIFIDPNKILLSADCSISTSARNKLVGRIQRIVNKAINSELSIDLDDGKSISVLITRQSVIDLQLRKGMPVCALFKANSITLLDEFNAIQPSP